MDPTASIDEPMLEAYTTLGFLAATTSSVRLGTMVTWATIRKPRAWLGVGAGYQADEAAKLGLPFEPTPERFSRLEELLQLAAHMWDGDPRPFHGPHHHLDAPINNPAPLTRPKVLIGGMGERRTFPLVARHADACNLFDIPDGGATLRRKLDVLAQVCDTIGRDPDDIAITLSSRLAPGETPGQFTDRCGQLAELGIDHVVLITTGPWQAGGDLDVVDAARPVGQIVRPAH
jgi:alkanesulfonate monooxygenase SsuD/methylene tetrahydromethanopterin reductase-like flavin-dependent oxidoreductase (luciferase family)